MIAHASLLSRVNAGLHMAPGDEKYDFWVTKTNRNTRKKSMQVARHVEAISHLTTSSNKNYLHTPILLSYVVAGFHWAAIAMIAPIKYSIMCPQRSCIYIMALRRVIAGAWFNICFVSNGLSVSKILEINTSFQEIIISHWKITNAVHSVL